MIQIYKNINLNTTENISPTGSTMDYRNGYFLNFETGRGDITGQFNVTEFLENPTNIILTDAFLQYIKNNFSREKIIEIKSDNQKLSDAFNFFYNKVIRGIVNTDISLVANNLISASTVNYQSNLYYPDGSKDLIQRSSQKYTNSADSYYIDVALFETQEILSRIPFELEATINSGVQVQKEVVVLNSVILSGNVVTERIASLEANPKKLIRGFVALNIQDSPFNNYSNAGLDFNITSFSGKSVLEIDAEIVGNVSSTESISPIGVNNVAIGDNITFTFKTVNQLKSIDSVLVDNIKTDYDRVDNLSKSLAGKYTFSSVTQNHSISVNFV